jgi:hypothetical protein
MTYMSGLTEWEKADSGTCRKRRNWPRRRDTRMVHGQPH